MFFFVLADDLSQIHKWICRSLASEFFCLKIRSYILNQIDIFLVIFRSNIIIVFSQYSTKEWRRQEIEKKKWINWMETTFKPSARCRYVYIYRIFYQKRKINVCMVHIKHTDYLLTLLSPTNIILSYFVMLLSFSFWDQKKYKR